MDRLVLLDLLESVAARDPMVFQDLQAPRAPMARPDLSGEKVPQATLGHLVPMDLMVPRAHKDLLDHQVSLATLAVVDKLEQREQPEIKGQMDQLDQEDHRVKLVPLEVKVQRVQQELLAMEDPRAPKGAPDQGDNPERMV